jgi:hypothetical protein
MMKVILQTRRVHQVRHPSFYSYWLNWSHRFESCIYVRDKDLVYRNGISMSQMLSSCRYDNSVISSIVTYHRSLDKSSTTDATSAVGRAYPSSNKRWRNPTRQSRMENSETLTTFDTQDTGRRQTEQQENNNKAKHNTYN